ncbi:MAG: methyl-accepting chemotaxis protein, partial [Devosia sp.]|uniref:Cache 3/Cache 2 fusion domain-containing protein n=1 Tax=Devosia sp. TaxID=1871048 RepID=UPI002619FBCE
MLARIGNGLGNIKLTTGIAGLVVMSILITVLAYSASNYLALRQQSVERGIAQQRSAMKVAATVLEQRLPGTAVTWADDGALTAIQGYALPFFHDTKAVDSVSRVTGGAVAIFAYDAAAKTFTAKSTSFAAADGKREINFEIDAATPAYAALSASTAYYGDADLLGTNFHGAFEPFTSLNGDLLGAFFVGDDAGLDQAQANRSVPMMATIGAGLLVVLGGISLMLSRRLTAPIPRIAGAMQRIADGALDAEVPYRQRRNEIGAMARAVEVFRENGLRVSQMTEAEAARIIADQTNRQAMMSELQNAFGVVVDAAIAGDFSRQVEVEFPDPELNALASSVNNLVATFNRGVSEIGV